MNFPTYKAGPVDHWLGEAFTVFVNGFISGLGGGTVAGAGTGAVTASTSLGEGVSTLHQILVAGCSAFLAAAGNGMKRVIVWHDTHPFPNPWDAPASTTKPEPPVL